MSAAKKKIPLKARRQRARIIALGAAVFLFLAFVVLVVFGLHRKEVNINTVSITGAHYIREDLVHQMVQDMLDGSYFFLVPRTSIFFYPKQSMVHDAYSLFPPLKEITIHREGFSSLKVSLTEREPQALWCTNASSSSPCFFMDENGLIFTKADDSLVGLPRYSGVITEDPLGATFLNGDYAKLDSFIRDVARATDRTPDQSVVDEHGDVTVLFTDGGELRFTRSDAGDALLANIESVFSSSRFKDHEPFEYVDFRFGNKVYVKFVRE